MSVIKTITVALILLLGGSSCEKFLELTPPDGLVLNEYWKSKEDVEAVLMGAYQKFAQMDARLFLYGELRGDLLQDATNTPGYLRLIMAGNIYSDNQLCDWQDFYLVINYCNLVLKYAPHVLEIDQTFTEYQKDGFEAQALFLRSLSYFYLVRIFKDVPFVLKPSEDDNTDFYLPKTADTVILESIKTDLEAGLKKVTGVYPSLEENKGKATRGAFLALLTDISLWNFQYQDVMEYAELLQEDEEYQLMPAGKWFENYYPGNTLESILEFQFDAGLDQSNRLYDYTYINFEMFLASTKALDYLAPENSHEIIRGLGSVRSRDAAIWKYCGAAPDGKTFRPSSEVRNANWIIYRYADVLLMKAEALSQTGRYSEALDIINRIRARALGIPVTISNSPEAFENAILDERLREMAFEGKRWFDLMRMGRRNNYQRKEELIKIIIEKVPATQRLVLAFKLADPYGWYLPIEEDELERNSNLVQNPYYNTGL